jgi:hypothetical protein
MLQQVWHVNELSLLKARSAKHMSKFTALSPVWRQPRDSWKKCSGCYKQSIQKLENRRKFLLHVINSTEVLPRQNDLSQPQALVTVYTSFDTCIQVLTETKACAHNIDPYSCEIVALRENYIDRPESYDSFSAKSCIFLAHEKTRTVWGIFFNSHTQPDPKQSIKKKKLLRHFPTTLRLVPSLTLQITDSSRATLENPTL